MQKLLSQLQQSLPAISADSHHVAQFGEPCCHRRGCTIPKEENKTAASLPASVRETLCDSPGLLVNPWFQNLASERLVPSESNAGVC